MKICPECQRCYEDADAFCAQRSHGALEEGRKGSRIIAGKYRLERLLGVGAMSAVYQSTQLDSAQIKAIKMLKPGYLEKDPAAIERLRTEFQTGDLVGHQNIIRVYDYIELETGEACIVMEFVEGKSLRSYMGQPPKPLPIDEAVNIAFQTAEGIDALHKKDILHRDLKPENIMLTTDKQGKLLVKVVDFGFAKLLKASTPARYSATAPIREFVGTMLYTSPENCRGDDLDKRSDIYSLGIILYEMLAGNPPFSGRNSEVEQKHLTEIPAPISTLRRETPPALSELVVNTLKKDPRARPQSARDFAHILKNIARSLDAGGLNIPLVIEEQKSRVTQRISRSGAGSQSESESPVPPKELPAKPLGAKANPSKRTRANPRHSIEEPNESYIRIPIMTPPISKNRRPLEVLNRHNLRPSREINMKRLALLASAIIFVFALVGFFFIYQKYKANQYQSYLDRGIQYLESGAHDQAMSEFSEAIRQDPTQAMPYYYRATAGYKKGDYEQAIKDYSEVIRITPEYALAYQNRASIYSLRGEYDKAIGDYTTLLRFAPDANSYKLRGDAYLKNKNYDLAIADYSEAIRIDGNHTGAFISRAEAYNKRGRKGDSSLASADQKRVNQLRKQNP
jgi:serine/threonine protein kinase